MRRFSPDMHLPGDIILKHLKMPTACYEPGCPPAYDDFEKPFVFNYTQARCNIYALIHICTHILWLCLPAYGDFITRDFAAI